MNIDDRCFLARQILYGTIRQLQTQADIDKVDAAPLLAGYAVEMAAFLTDDPGDLLDIDKTDAAPLLAGYAVEMAAFLTDDPAGLLADCAEAIMAGVKSRREFESKRRAALA